MNWLEMQKQVFLRFNFKEPSRVLFTVIGSVVDPSSTLGIKASPEKCEDFTSLQIPVSDGDIEFRRVRNEEMEKPEQTSRETTNTNATKQFDEKENDVNYMLWRDFKLTYGIV